ncbi:MAG UNVERIFIED_CONTAM: hypothetical protein LVT10_11055 [Anaerolineae bacterium]
MSGGLRGWAEANLLTCDERFDPSNLRIELDVLAAPPTQATTSLTPAPDQPLTPSPTTKWFRGGTPWESVGQRVGLGFARVRLTDGQNHEMSTVDVQAILPS